MLFGYQPPSGGCVLKLIICCLGIRLAVQPPSGGCVLKPQLPQFYPQVAKQPPSGGCVLKHRSIKKMAVTLTSRLQAAVC